MIVKMKHLLLIALLLGALIAPISAQTIRTTSNHLVAKIDSDGSVRDPNNHLVCKINSDGSVRDPNNHLLGKIADNGDVRDPNNHLLGRAVGIPKTWAALFFFIDL